MTHERRALTTEFRTNGRKLEGYAATFDLPADIGGRFIESISPGAFSLSLATSPDILALVDHDPGRVLARTRSGSLRLSEDDIGLHFSLDVPDTSAGRDVLTLAERGDLGGMSFGFTAFDEHREGDRRELRGIELHEISVVQAWPAYDGTVVQARSRIACLPHRAHAGRVLTILELSQ